MSWRDRVRPSAGLSKRQYRALFLVGVILGSVVFPQIVSALAGYLSNSGQVSGGVPFHASNGPAVTVTGTTDVNMTNVFPDSNTVELRTADGNITFVSTGRTNATVAASDINGTWTNLTGLDVASNDLYVNPDDKQPVNVSGDVNRLEFRGGMALDDGTTDFVYAGASGSTTVTVRGVKADTEIRAVDADTGELLAGSTTDSSGTVTLSGMPNSEHSVELKSSEGGPGLKNPEPKGAQADFPTEMAVDVSDPDFDDGENVTVEFYIDGSKKGETSTTSAGRVNITINKPSRGSHEGKAVATDSNGNTKTLTWTFSIANELIVREASDPWSKIDGREVEFTFYEGDDIYERSTSDGSLNLTGLPIDGDIVATVNATDKAASTNYTQSTMIIEDITKQQTVYLLADSVSTVEVRFTLDDQTGGEFEGNGATLFIQKPINRTGKTEWKTIHADEFGVTGVLADLEDGQRYRLIVKNDDNDQRIVGTYTADVSEKVPITIVNVDEDWPDSDRDFAWNATYTNASTNYVQFEYNDSQNLTDSVSVKIYEKGNESNVLLANQTFSGPLGTFAISEPVPAGEESTQWVVDVVGQRDGEQFEIRAIVGPRSPVLGDLPGWLKALISIGSIWLVAGLFSQLNGDVGALVCSGLGGMWWWTGFLPKETGVGVVVLALITAGVIFINERRGTAL